MKLRFGLRFKSIIIVTLLVILVSVSVAALIIHQETILVNDQFRAKGIALTKNLSYNSEYAVLTGNYPVLKQLAKGMMEQPDVIYCAIRDVTGKTLALEKEKKIHPDPPAVHEETVALSTSKKAVVRELKQNGLDYFDISFPIFGLERAVTVDEEQLFLTQEEWILRSEETTEPAPRKKIGSVNIGLSLRGVQKIIRDHKRTAAQTIFFLVISLSFLSAVGITIILAPIRRLVEGTRSIAGGKLDTRVDIKSSDELGSLADSFNDMVEELKKTTVSRDYFDNILRSIIDAMIIFSPEGKIISVNESACDILGYDKDEIIGKDIKILFSQHTVSKLGLIGKDFVKFIRENPTGPYEITFLTKNKTRIPILFSASDVYDRKGNVERIVGVGKDISILRKSEQELKRLNEQLKRNEQAVLNILTDLKKSHEELKTSQEHLLQSEKLASLGRLVSDMAHEVNNPLQIISGRAQLSLMSEGLTSEIDENLKIVVDQCERAKDVIQRLLLFSKPSRGERKKINVNDAMEFVIRLLEHQYELANIKVVREYNEDISPVMADEKQIHEVFMNLLRNSGDAMSEGGIITVTTSKEKGNIKIDVADTGGGISEDDLKRIFDPFFTTKEHGTGLGLSVCYGIIKSHGGEMIYTSKIGEGTTATIILPEVK